MPISLTTTLTCSVWCILNSPIPPPHTDQTGPDQPTVECKLEKKAKRIQNFLKIPMDNVL